MDMEGAEKNGGDGKDTRRVVTVDDIAREISSTGSAEETNMPGKETQVSQTKSHQELFDDAVERFKEADRLRKERGDGSPDYHLAHGKFKEAADALVSAAGRKPEVGLEESKLDKLTKLLVRRNIEASIEKNPKIKLKEDSGYVGAGKELEGFFRDNYGEREKPIPDAPHPPPGIAFKPEVKAKRPEAVKNAAQSVADRLSKLLDEEEKRRKKLEAEGAEAKARESKKPEKIKPAPPEIKPKRVEAKHIPEFVKKTERPKVPLEVAGAEGVIAEMAKEEIHAVAGRARETRFVLCQNRARAMGTILEAAVNVFKNRRSMRKERELRGYIERLRVAYDENAAAARRALSSRGSLSGAEMHGGLAREDGYLNALRSGSFDARGRERFMKETQSVRLTSEEHAFMDRVNKAWEKAKKEGGEVSFEAFEAAYMAGVAGEKLADIKARKERDEMRRAANVSLGEKPNDVPIKLNPLLRLPVGAVRFAGRIMLANFENHARRLSDKFASIDSDDIPPDEKQRKRAELIGREGWMIRDLDRVVTGAGVLDMKAFLTGKRAEKGILCKMTLRDAWAVRSSIEGAFDRNQVPDSEWLSTRGEKAGVSGIESLEADVAKIEKQFGKSQANIAMGIAHEVELAGHTVGALSTRLKQIDLLHADDSHIKEVARERLAEAVKRQEVLRGYYDSFVMTGDLFSYEPPDALGEIQEESPACRELRHEMQALVDKHRELLSGKEGSLLAGQRIVEKKRSPAEALAELCWENRAVLEGKLGARDIRRDNLKKTVIPAKLAVSWLDAFREKDADAGEVYERALNKWKGDNAASEPNLRDPAKIQEFAKCIDPDDLRHIMKRMPNFMGEGAIVILGSDGNFEIHKAVMDGIAGTILGDGTRIFGEQIGIGTYRARGLDKNPFDGKKWELVQLNSESVEVALNLDDKFQPFVGKGLVYSGARGIDIACKGEVDTVVLFKDPKGPSAEFPRKRGETINSFYERVFGELRGRER